MDICKCGKVKSSHELINNQYLCGCRRHQFTELNKRLHEPYYQDKNGNTSYSGRYNLDLGDINECESCKLRFQQIAFARQEKKIKDLEQKELLKKVHEYQKLMIIESIKQKEEEIQKQNEEQYSKIVEENNNEDERNKKIIGREIDYYKKYNNFSPNFSSLTYWQKESVYNILNPKRKTAYEYQIEKYPWSES